MAINSCEMTSDPSNHNTKETVSGQFTSIPILSLEQARNPDTKPTFLSELRDALLNVGFLYLADTGLPSNLIQRVKDETFKFFDESILSLMEKEQIEMKNEKSFLGWSRVSTFQLLYDSTQGVLQAISYKIASSHELKTNLIEYAQNHLNHHDSLFMDALNLRVMHACSRKGYSIAHNPLATKRYVV